MITLDRHIKELYDAGVVEKDVAVNQMEDPKMLDG
jgi:DNA-binding transcriptional ArsR family regulator